MVNLPYEEMHAPVVGPAHPYQKDGIAAGMKNHRTGHVEVTCVLKCSFRPFGSFCDSFYGMCLSLLPL